MFETDAEKQARKLRKKIKKENLDLLMQVNEIIVKRLKCLFYILVRDNISKSYLKGAVREMFKILKSKKGIYLSVDLTKEIEELVNKFLKSDKIDMKSFSDQSMKKVKKLPSFKTLHFPGEYKV